MSNDRRKPGGFHPVPEDIERQGEFQTGTGLPGRSPGLPGTMGLPPGVSPGGVPFSVPSPFKEKPPGGVDFNARGYGTGFTAANTPAVLPGSAFQIPDAQAGVIRSLVLTVNNLLLTSVLTWTLRFNESPVPGWQNLAVVPGPVLYFVFAYGPDEIMQVTPSGALVDVVFNVTDPGTYAAGVNVHGWYFEETLRDAMERRYK